MNNKTTRDKTPELNNGVPEHEQTVGRMRYVRPTVSTYDAARIIGEIGPAYGVYGEIPGDDWSL
jgi:hypothetical protein